MDDDHHLISNPPISSSRRPLIPDYTAIDRGACGIGFVADRHGRPSHKLLQLGLQSLINLQHRGALNADGVTGDGAGILTSLPKPFFAREAEKLIHKPVDADAVAVASLFLHPETIDDCRAIFEVALAATGLHLIAWRDVPCDPGILGQYARETRPFITQAIVSYSKGMSASEAERRLFITRKRFERDSRGLALASYVVSCSCQTIVYKGLLLAPQLSDFYADLRDPDFAPHIVLFHQRYSTNTLPAWHRAQPFRVLCHNGEINTIQGNIAWMAAREADLKIDSPDYHLRADDLHPVIDLDGSDSAMLDNAAELLVRGGRDIRHTLAMLMPSAWEKAPRESASQSVRDFYRYHAAISEPWDGPAAIVFTDGRIVGATLDRNGLRPLRYIVCDDGLIGAASEVGAVNIRARRILAKERLGPGQMFAVDTATGELLHDRELKERLSAQQPYGTWLEANLHPLSNRDFPLHSEHLTRTQSLVADQAAFGYTAEELVVILRPMVENRAEAIGSMGDDTPAAILSPKPRSLFSYFRQRFAEVTNPPIDYIREEHVMSLRVRLGHRSNLLTETPEHARVVELESPFLIDAALAQLRRDPDLRATTLSTLVDAAVAARPGGLAHSLRLLCARAESAARSGSRLIILSDVGVDAGHTFIPSLLAASAVHHDLLAAGLRGRVSLVVESGEPRDVHHLACLLAYGANAIHPYLALATAANLAGDGVTPARAMRNYLHAAEHGLFKIMAKMGITTVDAYNGAQIFEVVGLSNEMVARYFEGTPSHVGGLRLDDIARITLAWQQRAFAREKVSLASPGWYKFKRDGEVHAFSPEFVKALHDAVEHDDYDKYKAFSRLVHSRPPVDFRDLLDFNLPSPAGDAPGGEGPGVGVEAASSIVRRFSTAAMSHGALSKEAHETMSAAMNRIGAISNSGEGGEDPARYHNERNDRIKQVASGRFGVTAGYLVNADELQIKMAQGAKPGEGGQLPSNKVTAEIAALRHAQPGMILISPPPHHDIYSIEDLAQLIYDLRQINPKADVSVKLVAQAGVGTIAAGVAKAGADIILISGHNGGTGASPQSSIKYAGVAWELGLADAQHALVNSGLRGRVRLRVDGGLRTGRDVVIAACLGADEFSFGTSAAVAIGCVMARACHLNTCPTGIATQDPKLRARFQTPPEHLMSYMNFVAEEVRGILARLGLKSLQEAVGRVDLLKQASPGIDGNPPVDLSRLITPPDGFGSSEGGGGPRSYVGVPNPLRGSAPLNRTLLVEAMSAIETLDPVNLKYPITNRTRTFGALAANAIAHQYGDSGLPENTIVVHARGSAGQSFGAFGVRGMRLHLQGEANDYVGKGLAGGEIAIKPSPDYKGEHPVLAGNAILYGATGGAAFIAGRAGERFAVRNSGAVAVVEGVGDHGCEYMTGGAVVVLGPIGRNFGAGMSGGAAILQIVDFGSQIEERINPGMVTTASLTDQDAEWLKQMIEQHVQLTGSARAERILANLDPAHFVKVIPRGEPLKTPLRPEVIAAPAPTLVAA